jgi:CheY-like chemotaxis protein
VLADPTQVHQVLVNLATNAWHAIDGAGTVKVRVERSTTRDDRYPQLSKGEWAHLSVSDTGRGMSPETLSRIFEPFFSTKAPGQGTGLGLWVVRNIIKDSKGLLTLESTLGKGTRFDVYLPAFTDEAVTREAPSTRSSPAVSKTSLRLVYVDDEPAATLVVKRLLERRGHKVTTFNSAAHALAAIEKAPTSFDVFATDFNMPKISGLELLAKVRALRPEARLLLASGYVTDEMRVEAQRLGVEQIVYKASAEELCDAIDQAAIKGSA